ncbi:MAG: hypothetical protein Q8Q12_18965 [bacterium]|nr:hypothetical protein [bacterium]
MGKGKGSDLHRKCVQWVEAISRTPDTIITRERILGGVKLVDVLIYTVSNKKLVGVEVQLRATSHALRNIEVDLANGCHEVLIASPYPKVLTGVRRKVESIMPWHRERVRYLLIEFIPPEKKKNNTRNKAE